MHMIETVCALFQGHSIAGIGECSDRRAAPYIQTMHNYNSSK